MNLSRAAVGRPVATAMVFLVITCLGVFSFSRLQVDLFPELDFPSISIVTTYPGVSPEEMETLITRPIEEAIARVEGIDRIESFSSEGRSRVALRFDWGVGLDEALNDVRAAVERVRATIPEDADPPVVYKFDLATFPVVHLALATQMDEARMRRFAEDIVKPRLERLVGVASVDIRGAREREIRVELDPDRLAAHGISVAAVATALRNENLTVPAGIVESGDENVLVRAMSEFTALSEVEGALVAIRSGQPVRVRDVAQVIDDFERVTNIVRIDGAQGVELRISKSPDANTIEVVDTIYEAIASFNRDFEGTASLEIIVDSSIFIRRSIGSVQSSVLLGASLALIVLLLFLRSIRSTFVIGVAIPISVVGTFLLMYRLDLTLNLISFGGLALGIGMLVDNSIVILENIYRRLEAGDDVKEAAVRGSREVGSAIVASTLTTLTVFVPVIFLGGFAAVFFKEMALVVTSALVCSLFVALTLVPVLASVVLNRRTAPDPERPGFLGRLEMVYATMVRWSIRHPIIIIALAIGVLAGAWTQSDQIGSELLPESDESEVRVNAEYPSGTRIEVTEAAVLRLEEAIRREVPEVTNILVTIGTPGFWSTSGGETAAFRVNLVPPNQRARSSTEIAAALRSVLPREVPGMRVVARPGGGLFIFQFIRGGDARVRVDIRGYDIATADRLGAQISAGIQEIAGVSDARPSRVDGGRELRLHVDRDRAADYGLSTRDVAETISLLVQGRDSGVFREGGSEYRIRTRLSDRDLASIDRLLTAPIVLPSGRDVQLNDLVTIGDGRTPQAIDRLNQERILIVSAGVDGTRDLGAINADVERMIRTELQVPDDFTVLVAGESAEQGSAFAGLAMGLILALLLIYMVMAGQFESFVQPLVIMASVPFAAIGVIGTMVLTGTTLNLNSFMGVIVLLGVVVNNAIVMVDYINMMRREQGVELAAAVVESARRRLRPILMTTATTVLALTPVAIGTGAGGDTQAPLARVVVGGLLSATPITLFIIPVVYVLVERTKARLVTIFSRRDVAGVGAETPPSERASA